MARVVSNTSGRPRRPRRPDALGSLGWRCCTLCVAVLAWQWRIDGIIGIWTKGHFGKGYWSFAQFVAIPICHGASASLNQLARAELEGSGMSIRATKGRWYMEASDVNRSNLLEDLRDVRHVRSIRRIISCFKCTSASDIASLVKLLDEGTDWDSVLEDLDSLRAMSENGATLKPLKATSFCLVCKKLSKLTALGAEASHLQELAQCLERRLGWLLTGRGRSPDVTVHVHVEGSFISLEIPFLFQNQMMLGSLPFQGMHHVEAWAIARSLDLHPGEVVLDPMCGQGTLLAEAAIWWPNASFVGCDVNGSQLERCNQNFKALSRRVSLHQVDATEDGGIPLQDRSVEKIMVAPPWNRQFAIRGRPQEFYEKMFRELFRVVSDTGRIVLFVSRRVLQRIKDALEAVDVDKWSLVEERSFTVTHKTIGIILTLEAVPKSHGCGDPTDRLFWERDAPSDGRDLYEYWREVRARGFPRLNPVN